MSSDSEIIQFWFTAYHYQRILEQSWFTSERHWNREFLQLKMWNSVDFPWLCQFWTRLLQRKSELISSETPLLSADVFHVLWISIKKRQMPERNSAKYPWDFNPGWHLRQAVSAGNSGLPKIRCSELSYKSLSATKYHYPKVPMQHDCVYLGLGAQVLRFEFLCKA